MTTVGSKGKCLNIPLAEGVDSLNVASALTLILYELRKPLMEQLNRPTAEPTRESVENNEITTPNK